MFELPDETLLISLYMTIFSLYIINKAGGLIYRTDFSPPDADASTLAPAKLTSNEYLVLAGTFHGVHAITSKISPTSTPSSGLEVLESDAFRLECFQTMTGTKLVVLTDPTHTTSGTFLKSVYGLYADYVMKNPFYTPEMPIKCELFDQMVLKLVKSVS